MKENKFRGMTILGELVYGLLSISQGKGSQPDKGYYISNASGMPWAFSVRPETIGQYTGLKDWWENDIGEHPVSKERFVVKWNENRGQWCAVYNGDQWHPLYMQVGDRGLAINIGNIHEDEL